jgi:flagellar motor switch/type III secretory pathway protein FliN
VSYYGARLHEAPGAHVSLQGSCAVCWTMPPDSERCVLTVELALVTRGLELMLREGEERHTTALSHRDFALFLYVLLRGQAAMLGVSELVPLSCLANAPSAEEVHEALRSGLDVMECAFHVRLGAAHGWARLWVPSHMLDRAELFLRRGGLTEAEVEALASSALGDSLASLDVVAGVTSLGASELGDVSRGDIILFDEHGLQLDDDETTSSPGARVMLRGAGGSWISAQLKPSATGRWSVILHTPIHQPTTPRSEQMTQEHAASQTLGQQAAQEVPVLVEVRIGTLQAPLTTLARLTRGQVLTLNQPIGAPVEILAGGRVIATGELVNVEGRVGVRVL